MELSLRVATPLTSVGCLFMHFPVKLLSQLRGTVFSLSFRQVIKGLMSGLIRNRLPTHNKQIKFGKWKNSEQV